MAAVEKDGPNADQIEFWNGEGGQKFIKYQNALDEMLEPFGNETISRLGIKSGEVVLDIGCGCGATTLEIARRVGAKGEAVGVDISEPMLARAEDAAAHAELTNIFFERADVETGVLHRDSFDAAFSRFGIMFFETPETALTNVGKMLHDKGRIGFACWQPLEKNPWIAMQIEVVMPLIDEPPAPLGPEDPGPFSFADPDRVRRILTTAGFGDIQIESYAPEIVIGATHDLDDAAEFALDMGPASRLLADASAEVKAKSLEGVKEAFGRFHTDKGVVLESAAWIVTASK